MNHVVSELQNKAQALRKSSQWADALQVYRQLWYTHRESCGPWEGWGYAQCLYKLHQYPQAAAQCRESLESWPDHAPLRNLLAWCLYHTQLKAEETPLEQLEAVLDEILSLSQPSDAWGPAQRAIFWVMNRQAEADEFERVLETAARLDPFSLSNEPESLTDPKGKVRKLPSPRMKWYARQSEALLRTGAWQACATVCRDVLAAGISGDQRFWFERRLARSLAALGEFSEAEALYLSLLKRKQDWFLYKEQAELLLKQNQPQKALEAACQAALAPGEPEKKLNLYLLLAELLLQLGQADSARRHQQLVLALRQAHGWSLPDTLLQAVGPNTPWPQPAEQITQLRPVWQSHLPQAQNTERHIAKLLPNGLAGFIATPQGPSYYFQNRDYLGPVTTLKPGLKVSFEIIQGYDHKKQKPALQAIRVQPLQTSSI